RTRGHWKPPTCEPDAIVAGRHGDFHQSSMGAAFWLEAQSSSQLPDTLRNILAYTQDNLLLESFTEGGGLVWACGLGWAGTSLSQNTLTANQRTQVLWKDRRR